MNDINPTPEFDVIDTEWRRREHLKYAFTIGAALCCATAFSFAGGFEFSRYEGAPSTVLKLAADSWPPDFSRWREWGRPLLETLATGVTGTVLGAALALPFAALAAQNIGPSPFIRQSVRIFLNAIRSLPGLIWGVIFVAAIGFGPLPGAFALGVHSTGMLGKLFFEAMEHVDPSPGAALKAHGASELAVFRFAVLPQAVPRLVDALIYRFEHNLRAATTLGVIGAGGLGLQIVTAFHLFEYKEASALIILLLIVVTAVNLLGARVRRRLLAL
ncbi:phosphonate ABC transporter, permease protein PhnE [Methylocystis parvus]|uniref:Phosphonate ABC transporter, permease protein PhnE n=1 Tax=Methylocystis parvus TaxID=134 RepID=A0A6B8M7B1_9HYPH|nr:phosphonate ABC transporter, permease protein PhnE [Methylocystis parvus]QGM97539.1 phosphonate ABC transporter, permease protein PhnE [Methylocystis parvus]WBJ98535.1 phosphonate ABC transporter, permease protein PhnE [Methylocystis parvus OBBP]